MQMNFMGKFSRTGRKKKKKEVLYFYLLYQSFQKFKNGFTGTQILRNKVFSAIYFNSAFLLFYFKICVVYCDKCSYYLHESAQQLLEKSILH